MIDQVDVQLNYVLQRETMRWGYVGKYFIREFLKENW